MNLKLITMAFYSTYLTNKFGFLLRKEKSKEKRMELREEYMKTLFLKLKLKVKVLNEEKLPLDGQYLLVSNHRSIIDPLIIESALSNTKIKGFWIAKKELYNSFFFGMFTRNAGSILLDREAKNMAPFFKDIKDVVKGRDSIYIFPEGTRNKTQNAIGSFKEGARIIALKNRLPILPVYIKTNAYEVLKEAINSRKGFLEIEIEIGDMIDYKDKTPLEENYKNKFNLK